MNASHWECFRDTVAHRRPRQTPYNMSFTKSLEDSIRAQLRLGADVNLTQHFGFHNPAAIALTPPQHPKVVDFSRYFTGVERVPGDSINGLGVLETPGGFYHFMHYTSPLRDATRIEELMEFPYPSLGEFTDDGMGAAVNMAHARGVATRTWVGGMYEDAWLVRGYEPFLMDMLDRPEWCAYILDRFTDRNMVAACAAARAGVDMIASADDVANQRDLMFSIEQWRQFIKPRWAKVYAAARAIKPDIQISYHSDGNIERIIPELIEIGVTILNPIQPECIDPVSVKRRYGNQITLDGAIGTQSVMPFGTPDDVRKTVKAAIEQLGADGGLILSPTHVLEPEVPLANILAFVDAARDYGSV